MTHTQYPATVFWSDEDEGYIAVAPDLPGSSAFGETREEALRELDDAIEAWIGAAHKAGNPVPSPSLPKREPVHSGKVLLRLPKSLHASLAADAERDGTSLNQYIVYVLSSHGGKERLASSYAKDNYCLPAWSNTISMAHIGSVSGGSVIAGAAIYSSGVDFVSNTQSHAMALVLRSARSLRTGYAVFNEEFSTGLPRKAYNYNELHEVNHG